MTVPLASILAKVEVGGFLFAPWLAKHPYKSCLEQPPVAFGILKQAVSQSRTACFAPQSRRYRKALQPRELRRSALIVKQLYKKCISKGAATSHIFLILNS